MRELYEQAVDAFNRGQYDRAIELYSQINKMAPRFAPAYVGIGLALKSKGADIDEVVYYYKTATDMDPTNVQAWEQLGRLYYSINKFDRSEKSFVKALAIDPGLQSAKLSLAWIYLLAKPRPEVAIRYFTELSQSSPTPNVYLGLGMAYFANNDRVQAMEMITTLRKMGQEDYAKQLEQMVRDNQKVVLVPDTPGPVANAGDGVLTSNDKPANNQVPPLPTESGIKVRLRGKLSEAD